MRRADRLVQPIRPAAVSARCEDRLASGQHLVNLQRSAAFADLEAVSTGPELAAVIGDVLSVALKLTLMLPRTMQERFVECIIGLLDELDGDPDLEWVDEREPEREW